MGTEMENLDLKHVQAVIQGARDYNNKAYGHRKAPRPLWNQLHAVYNDASDACYEGKKAPTQILDELVKNELTVLEMWNDHRLGMAIGNEPQPNFEDHVKDLSGLEADWDATWAGLTYHPIDPYTLDLFEASGDVREVWDAYPSRATARNLGVPFTEPGPMVKNRGTARMLQKARESGVSITSTYAKPTGPAPWVTAAPPLPSTDSEHTASTPLAPVIDLTSDEFIEGYHLSRRARSSNVIDLTATDRSPSPTVPSENK